MQTRVVIFCPDSKLHWYDGVDEPACNAPDHSHQQFEVHVHRSVVALPDGTEVVAVSFDPADPYTRTSPPDYGLYLDQSWEPPWEHDHTAWPDFGVPEDPTHLVAVFGFAACPRSRRRPRRTRMPRRPRPYRHGLGVSRGTDRASSS